MPKDSQAQVTALCSFIAASLAAAALTGPVSVSVLVGENALFHCTGTGVVIQWVADGIYVTDTDSVIVARGISATTLPISSDMIRSTLTVPATSVNNGTTVHCILFPASLTSNNATLTVLPGIGKVVNVRFGPFLDDILWDPPPTAGVLGGIFYKVLVLNNNTGHVIISATTNNTYFPIATLQLCQYYTANVTTFSSEHHSDSVVTQLRVPGEYYDLTSVSVAIVVNNNTTHSAVAFIVNILQRSPLVCPDQKLVSVTYPTTDSNKTTHTEMDISQPGVIEYIIFVERSCHCLCDFIIVADNREAEKRTVSFSSYNVQSCDVISDHTSIIVTCAYAINSTAPGFVVIQKEQAQTTINKILTRLDNNEGSVNITDLSPGNYTVKVYDYMKDDQPAYQLEYQLQSDHINPSAVFITSDIPAAATTTSIAVKLSADNTPLVSKLSTTIIIIASSITTGLLLLFIILVSVVITIVIVLLNIMRKKQQTRGTAGIVDHVPVEDNPAYITLKKITLNRNSAYETVNIK